MALHIIPIIKAIAPLIAASTGIVASLGERQAQEKSGASAERIKKLEDDLLRMGEVLAGAMEQLQATADALRLQSEINGSLESRLRNARILAMVALCLSVAALVVSIVA